MMTVEEEKSIKNFVRTIIRVFVKTQEFTYNNY